MKWFKRHPRKAVLLIILCLLVAAFVVARWPATPVEIVVSYETTRLSGPLNPDGTVNYVAALNAIASEGVTADNNAAIPIILALGPDFLPAETRHQILAELGMTMADLEGRRHFVSWERRSQVTPVDELPPLDDGESWDQELADTSLPYVLGLCHAGYVHPDIAPWLDENAPALALLREASQRERYYLPLVSTTDPPELNFVPFNLRALIEAVRALSLRANLGDDHQAAWADVMVIYRLTAVTLDSCNIVRWIIMRSMDIEASRAVQTLATAGLPAGSHAQILQDLATLPPFRPVDDVVDVHERYGLLDSVGAIRRGRPYLQVRIDSELDWNAMLRDVNIMLDEAIAAAGGDAAAADRIHQRVDALTSPQAMDVVDKVMAGVFAMIVGNNSRLGRRSMTQFYTEYLWEYVPVVDPSWHRLVDANRDLARLAVALDAYRIRNGHYPASLEDLSPELLAEIPLDVFTGEPLSYERTAEGYSLQSAGRWGRRGQPIGVTVPPQR